jgi:MFS family permease
MKGLRRALVAVAAGLVLADASIVALALPPILVEMNTTITGVAAIVGIYALVLALGILPAARLRPERAGVWGLGLFAVASLGCGLAGSLGVLLACRVLQALGGAAALLAAFGVLDAGGSRAGRRLWVGAALAGTAAGPALGGALTEAFDWRAIFFVQVPIAAAAAISCLRAAPEPAAAGDEAEPRLASGRIDEAEPEGGLWSRGPAAPTRTAPLSAQRDSARVTATDFGARPAARSLDTASLVPLASLAFTAAAFTAILFLLVIELVAGFAISPLRAALGLTVLPVAALAAAAIPGPPRPRALAGAVLLAGGAAALAFLPAAGIAWTVVPQLLAGAGMGLALPAYSGELLPERNVAEAARVLVARHVGIVVVLAILAPVATHKLDVTTERAILQGAALVLDAQIDPLQKLALAPALFENVDVDRPRAALQDAVDQHRGQFADDAAVYDRLAGRLDDVVVVAVEDAFKTAYLIAAALALLAAALLFTAWRKPAVWLATAAAVATVAVYASERNAQAPAPVALQDPCTERQLPEAGGFAGAIQNEALQLLDRAACQVGTSREEYALALFDPERAKQFERDHGVNPRGAGGLLSLLGG